MHEAFEYKIVHCTADRRIGSGLPADLNQKFDEYGAQGWELVGTEAIQRATFFPYGGAQTVGVVGFFKRRVQA